MNLFHKHESLFHISVKENWRSLRKITVYALRDGIQHGRVKSSFAPKPVVLNLFFPAGRTTVQVQVSRVIYILRHQYKPKKIINIMISKRLHLLK